MSDFSNYAENAIANALFRNVAYTSPTTVYLALGTAVTDPEAPTWTELSGNGYARQAITFGAPSNGQVANTNTITFGPNTGTAWGTVTVCAIYDSLTTGNALSVVKALTSSRTVAVGDSLQFTAGNLTFTVQ